MYYYAYSLRQARFIMVNSSWTKNHVDSILNHSDRALDMIHLLPPLVILELLSRRRSECPKAAQIVYPSCDTRQMTVFPIEGRERLILSLAQFRLVECRLNGRRTTIDIKKGPRRTIQRSCIRSRNYWRTILNIEVMAHRA